MAMNTHMTDGPFRESAIRGLAVVGFISLLGLGIWGAIYSARFVPTAVGNLGSAAVYLGSLFSPAPTPSLDVVGTASSTYISFGTPATTTASTTPATPPKTPAAPVVKTPGTPIIVEVPAPVVAPYGLSDLAITITKTGYLNTSSTDSFVASDTVPSGKRAAVQFTVKNIGTNYTGTWRFSASIPTKPSTTYKSDSQQSLAPGDSIDYTLGFDRAIKGTDQKVTVTIDPDHKLDEASIKNNVASATLTIK